MTAPSPRPRPGALSIWLVRHAEREATSGDPGLTAAGRLHAHELAKVLGAQGVAAVYTSPLRRASETAEVISSALGRPLVVEPDLRERANWGDVPGESFETFTALWERCSRERDYAPPGRDSARTAGARLGRFLERSRREHAGRSQAASIVAVTHGGLIVDFVVDTFEAADIATHQPDFDPIFGAGIATCSVTQLIATGAGWELGCVGLLAGRLPTGMTNEGAS
jgi:broad specificity phosphatase PhoE